MLTCCVCAGAWAQGTLNVPEVKRSTENGGTVRQAIIVKKSASSEGVVKIQLANGANYRDMQFDLTLPEGISLVNVPTTENPVVKVDAINDEHHVLFYALEGQTVKIAVVDNVVNLAENTQSASAEDYGKYLADGIVFELPIKAAATFEGVKDAAISNLAFTDDAATADIAVTGTTTFGIDDILLGDVNDDGAVNMADGQAIIFTFLGEAQPIFVEEVANASDSDNEINMADGQQVIFMYLESQGGNAKPVILKEENYNELDPE